MCSKATGCVGTGADNADTLVVLKKGATATNMFPGNSAIIVEYVTVSTPVAVW